MRRLEALLECVIEKLWCKIYDSRKLHQSEAAEATDSTGHAAAAAAVIRQL